MSPVEDNLSESEGRMINALVHQLRVVHPAKTTWWQQWSPLIFSIITACFVAITGFSITGYFRGVDRLEQIARTVDENRVRSLQGEKELSGQGEAIKATNKRLDEGRETRIANDKEQAQKQSDMQASIAVLNNDVRNIQNTLDRLIRKLEEVRRNGDGPFEENRIENLPPFQFNLKASNDADRP